MAELTKQASDLLKSHSVEEAIRETEEKLTDETARDNRGLVGSADEIISLRPKKVNAN
jgi:hypothetical protein